MAGEEVREAGRELAADDPRRVPRVYAGVEAGRVLVFKWSEYDIPAEKVWQAIGEKPLFGHHSGKQSRTFWACFMKLEET